MTDAAADGAVVAPIGGPNVCRSPQTGAAFCCPGWTLRGITGLCLVPVCVGGCGSGSRCIKPNLCLCRGGRIQPRCRGESGGGEEEEGGRSEASGKFN